MTYLDFFMKDSLLDESELMPFCEQERGVSFMSPQPTTYDAYIKHVDENLAGDTPLAFGMHPNAEIGFRTDQSETLFKILQELQPQDAGSSGGDDEEGGNLTPAGVAEQVLNDIIDRFGDKKFDMDDIEGSIDDKGPYQNVFLQECEAFNVILAEMMRSLLELNQGLAGELTMSGKMEALQSCMFMDRVPGPWAHLAWPSLRSLAMWLTDLNMRYDQFLDWTGNPAEIPRLTWISGFRNPQSFLTAIKQISAQASNQPLDKMVTSTEVTKKMGIDELDSNSRDGAYVNGFFIEGARWNTSNGVLEPSKPKEMFLQMPIINVKSILAERRDLKSYQCPCYGTRQRGPTYIFVAQLKSKDPTARWIMAGVAMLTDIE
jgi:dynein heavy chain